MKVASKCMISRSVDSRSYKSARSDAEKILNNLMPVRIADNAILDEIMKNQQNWLSNPTIIIDNHVYKLKILTISNSYVEMLQHYVYVYKKNNGKDWYEIINTRKVQIHY